MSTIKTTPVGARYHAQDMLYTASAVLASIPIDRILEFTNKMRVNIAPYLNASWCSSGARQFLHGSRDHS